MEDTDSKIPVDRRNEIINQIQTYDHDVLTTREVADGITKSKKTALRHLKQLRDEGRISGRKPDESDAWMWWVTPENLSAEDSVATAQEILRLLGELFERRGEFKIMAMGALMVHLVFSLAFFAAIVSWLGIQPLSAESILAMMGAGFLVALILIFGAVFIFPYETVGSWPTAMENTAQEE